MPINMSLTANFLTPFMQEQIFIEHTIGVTNLSGM